jgi:Zn-dependent protease
MRGDTDWLEAAFVIILVIVSLGVHEAAHAWSAWKLGDSTAKDMGRMTITPLVHIDPFMTILLPAMCALMGAPIFGGAKPVPVNFIRLRNPWVDMAVVAFAGPLSNLILACLFLALFKFFVATGYYNGAALSEAARDQDLLPRVMMASVGYNVMFFVFNLIPIPPLDGSRIMVNTLPPSLRESYYALGGYGLFIIYAVFHFWPGFQELYFSIFLKVFGLVDNIVSMGGRW